MNILSVVFIAIIATGMISVGANFEIEFVYKFVHSDLSAASLFTSSIRKLLDVRNGDINLEPYYNLNNLNIYIYGLTQRTVGNDYIYDANPIHDVVRMKNGYLTTNLPRLTDNRLSEITDGITAFSEYLSDEGIDFLFMSLPSKVCPYDKALPVSVKDYSNENVDKVLSTLQANAVDTFDISTEIEEAELDWSSLFFRTDHHWLPSTALWASQRLCEVLNVDYGFNIDTALLDISRFSRTTYKKHFLGSLGKRVGRFYTGADDFTLILPKYNTNMVYSYHPLSDRDLSGDEIAREGTFEDTCIESSFLLKNLMGNDTYYSYSISNFPGTAITNNNLSDGRILLIRDSFGATAAPFLSLAACHELYTLDLRYYRGSVAEYTKKLCPNIVIVMLEPSQLIWYDSISSNYRFDFISGV